MTREALEVEALAKPKATHKAKPESHTWCYAEELSSLKMLSSGLPPPPRRVREAEQT